MEYSYFVRFKATVSLKIVANTPEDALHTANAIVFQKENYDTEEIADVFDGNITVHKAKTIVNIGNEKEECLEYFKVVKDKITQI